MTGTEVTETDQAGLGSHWEEFRFHSEMRICWKGLSKRMICSEPSLNQSPIILDVLGAKGRSRDYSTKIW